MTSDEKGVMEVAAENTDEEFWEYTIGHNCPSTACLL